MAETTWMDAKIIDAAALESFARTVLTRAGAPADQAADAAAILLWANLRGVDTHGVRNLRRLYVERMLNGDINPAPTFRVEQETPVTARVDGDRGLGLAVGPWAMRLAIQKAKSSGVGIVAVNHSHHYGAAGAHAWMALEHGMIGVSLTAHMSAEGSEIGVVPTFAKRPMLSTNPIAVAVPTGVEEPWVLDMATSITPYNRVIMYHETGRTLPLGWALDAHGQPTTDPMLAKQLPPLGGTREMGGHKGYGLSVMVQILCSMLSGGWEPGGARGYHQQGDSHFFAAINVEAFRPLADFKAGMDAMIDAFHQAEPLDPAQPVMVAGEPEAKTLRRRAAAGIPLPPNVVEDMHALAQQFDVPIALA